MDKESMPLTERLRSIAAGSLYGATTRRIAQLDMIEAADLIDQLRKRLAEAEELCRFRIQTMNEQADRAEQAEAKLVLAEQDARRLDWLTAPEAIDRHVYQCGTGEWCAQEDALGAWYGATPREAIDAAIVAGQNDDDSLPPHKDGGDA